MSIDSDEELQGLKRVGAVVARALKAMREAVREGVTTAELDAVAADVLERHGARSAPRAIYGFPGTACISVNDEAVHGVPGARVLKRGDVVTLDVTAELDGYFADAAVTVPVPPVSPAAKALVECAEAAFWRAAQAATAGALLSRIGGAVESEVRRRGFRVMRELCGHGIGRSIHEPPEVLNFFDRFDRTRLSEGLVIAVEPIVSAGSDRTRSAPDGWTLRSADGGLTAHFEHTLVVTRQRPVLVTAA